MISARLISIFIFIFTCINYFCFAYERVDVIYLKDSSVYKGKIVNYIPKKEYKISCGGQYYDLIYEKVDKTETQIIDNDVCDVVFLKNGTKKSGQIVEIRNDKSIKLMAVNKICYVYNTLEIDRIEKISNKSVDKPYPELGVVYGAPATINLALGAWSGLFGVRISGLYVGKYAGFQFNFNLKLINSASFLLNLALIAGVSYEENDNTGYKENMVKINDWSFWGAGFDINYRSIFLEVGILMPSGYYNNPRLNLQFGIIKRFLEKNLYE